MSENIAAGKSLGEVWQQFFVDRSSQSPTTVAPEEPRDTVSSLRKASSMKKSGRGSEPVTILSTVVRTDWETMLPGTNRHIDELDTSDEGFLYSADIVKLLQESHSIEENLLVRYFHPEWAAWGKLPRQVTPAARDTGELWLEVRAQVQGSKPTTPAPVIPNEQSNNVVVDSPSEGESMEESTPERHVQELENADLVFPSQGKNSSPVVLKDADETPADKFTEFFGSEVNGNIDDAWLIVERMGETALPPLQGESERTICGKTSFLETYRSLLPLALQWFQTNELHPNSPKLYGAEGDILLSPEKLLKIEGLESYFDQDHNVDRFLLFLAISRDAFTTKNASRVTGRWKAREDTWSTIPTLPGVLFQDLKWEDDPGQDWNENWNCFLHILIPESSRNDPASHSLAAVRFVKAPWKVPVFIRPYQRTVQTDILAVRPQLLNPAQDGPGKVRSAREEEISGKGEVRPGGGQGPNVERSISRDRSGTSGRSWGVTDESVFGNIEPEKQVEYDPSVADTEGDILPPVTHYPDIEVPMLSNGEVDWDHAITKTTLRQIVVMLGEIERILNHPEPERTLPLILLSVDKLHPFIRFLRMHRNFKTCEGALVQAQNLLYLGLQTVHKEFMAALDGSSKPPEREFDLREDLIRQLEDIQMSGPEGQQTLKIPEMPDESSVKVLNALVSRLVVPEWKPRNGISFKDRRGEALVRNLRRLGVQEIRQDQVNQMRWEALEQKMKLWMDQMNISVRILFAAERMLCDRVLLSLDPLGDRCFSAVAGDSLRWLIGCGNILAGSRRAPEKLIALLDMYSVVLELMPAVEEFFRGKSGESYVRSYKEFVGGLGRVVKDTAKTFEQTILHEGAQIDAEQKVPGKLGKMGRSGSVGKAGKGAEYATITADMAARVKVQPLTSYVVNYLRLLSSESKSYIDTLDHIYNRDNRQPGSSADVTGGIEGVSGLFSRIMRALDHNLLAKSKMQGDLFMEEVFLLNNMTYVVENVSSCEVGFILGSEWRERHDQEMRKRRDHFVSLIIHKLDSQVFSLPKGDSRATASRLKVFNAEFEHLLQNKSYLLLTDHGLQAYVCHEVRKKVSEDYKKFLELHREFINTQRSVSKHFLNTIEEVGKRLATSFHRETLS